jgi:hypothetical protein
MDISNPNKLIPGNKDVLGIGPERILYLDNNGDGIKYLEVFINNAYSSLNKRNLLSGGKLTKKNRTKGKKNRTKGKKNRTKCKKNRTKCKKNRSKKSRKYRKY